MKLRITKKMCKKDIKRLGLEIIKTIKRLFIVKSKPNFICTRWYLFTITAENNPRINELIKEQNEMHYSRKS